MIFHVYAGPSTQHCAWCQRAKALLEEKGQVFQYHNVTETISRDDFMALFELVGVAAPRSVPQIFMDVGSVLYYIGGFTELQETLKAAYD